MDRLRVGAEKERGKGKRESLGQAHSSRNFYFVVSASQVTGWVCQAPIICHDRDCSMRTVIPIMAS